MSFDQTNIHMTISLKDNILPMELSEAIPIHVEKPLLREILSRTVTVLDDTNIPNGVTRIYDYMFQYNSGLTTIDLSKVTAVGAYTFYSCGITDLNMPNLQEAGTLSFAVNPMEEAEFPSLLTATSYMLSTCPNLKILDFGSLTAIETRAFYGCENLDTIVFRGDAMIPFPGSSPFTGTKFMDGEGHFYVKPELLNDYRTDSGWSYYSDKILSIDDYHP